MSTVRFAVKFKRCAVVAMLLFAGCVASSGAMAQGAEETALDRYVNTPDPHYAYELLHWNDEAGYNTYVLEMTSQKWLDEETVDRPIWKHWLVIVRPDEVDTNIGFLYIGAGNNTDDAPAQASPRIVALAQATNSVVGQLYMVPNQPLTFVWDETRKRYEDEIIAYTWDKYLRGGDEKWPLRLPMTKSAVRAMDTITSFAADDRLGNLTVDRFVVAGGSKRGWTTWTTAAVDDRVVAIAPIVIDMLNMEPSFIHHYEVYGRYAEAIRDYEEMKIMDWLGTPENDALMKLVEPYEYRSRYTMPKFMINAAGDQFFIPDSSQFYFDDLPGEKYMRYVPNGDHGLGGTDALESLVAWYHAIVNDVKRPEFSWTFDGDNTIRVTAEGEPSAVKLWRATNADARNFQLQTIGPAWASTDLRLGADGSYRGAVQVPLKGWTAFFVELTYPSGTSVPFKFTTAVRVVPDVKPFKFRYSSKSDRAEPPKHR